MHLPEKYVTVAEDIVGGALVFKDTRVTVKTIFDHLEESSLKDFLKKHSTVTREQTEAVIKPAAEKSLTEISS